MMTAIFVVTNRKEGVCFKGRKFSIIIILEF